MGLRSYLWPKCRLRLVRTGKWLARPGRPAISPNANTQDGNREKLENEAREGVRIVAARNRCPDATGDGDGNEHQTHGELDVPPLSSLRKPRAPDRPTNPNEPGGAGQ